jgi:phenylalanyl-tRNA synthetase beta chain
MRIPVSWLKEFVVIPKSLDELCEKLTLAGHMLDKIDCLAEETVIDLELRGNRADCYSILGIAREVSALFKTPLKLPSLYGRLKKVPQLKEVTIEVESPLVKRVVASVVKEIKIEPSPDWMQKRLLAYGIPPINNIVDATNYVMVEIGEPMHAFDLAAIGPKVAVRLAKQKETIVTFEGTLIELTKEDLVFANPKVPLSIAGAIGGKNFSILPTTKEILVEAAAYERVNIRRTCRRHCLTTDAGLRHEKELDPNLAEMALSRFLQLIEENHWGKIEKAVFDYYPEPRKEISLSLSYEHLEKLTGLKIEKEKVKEILTSLSFKIEKEIPEGLKVKVPTFRTDVLEEADLVEEVLRIYGYDKIPEKTLDLEIPKVSTPAMVSQEEKFKQALVSLGFDEVISSSFVNEKSIAANVPLRKEGLSRPVTVENPPSPDFQVMRMSLLPNLLEFAKKVKDERGEQAQFFEIGKIYFREKNEYQERRKLGLIVWERLNADFVKFKGLLEAFLKIINLENVAFEESQMPVFGNIQFKIVLNKKTVGFGGLVKENAYFAEIDLEEISGYEQPPQANLWPKYPPIIEDFSFVVPPQTPVAQIAETVKSTNPLIKRVELVDIYDQARTFRLTYQSPERGLTDKEIRPIREKIIQNLEKKGIKVKGG